MLRKAYLEITNICNLSCSFCPGTRREKSFMSTETFSILASKLRDPFDPKQVKKASDALVRRGFSWSQAAEGIERARNRRQDETDQEV